MDETSALARLNKEKEIEDKLVSDLSDYFILRVDEITDFSFEKKEMIKNFLRIIRRDSEGHKHTFDMLIQRVVENGDDTY
jgi:hypothetical protein